MKLKQARKIGREHLSSQFPNESFPLTKLLKKSIHFHNKKPVKVITFSKIKKELKKGEDEFWATVKCPVCDYERTVCIKVTEEQKNSSWMFFDTRFNFYYWISKLVSCFDMHITSQVRLSGNMKHINLMIQSFGNSYCVKVFDRWAKKNIIIAVKLNKIIEELRND